MQNDAKNKQENPLKFFKKLLLFRILQCKFFKNNTL